MKFDQNDRVYHLCDIIQEEARKFLHVIPEMHAGDFLQL